MPLVPLAKPMVKERPRERPKAMGKSNAKSSEFDKALHDQQIELFKEAVLNEKRVKKKANDKFLW